MNSFSPASVNGHVAPGEVTDPVFVLCMARSGSTLLRFLLDAHPELACPPETSLPALCGQLAVVWSLIEGAPLSANRGDAPPEVPDPAIAGIRRMVDEMTGGYLARRGKKRFCDKSLGSARAADLLMRVYPGAKFICLYRHPMDMIRSGLDACPWGLNGYGFEQYAGSSPGNTVMALARYWLENAAPIVAFEEQHQDRCHRVRYEDLVTAPEQVAGDLFEFLGAVPAPGITDRCFTGERERFGPADYKIWATSAITGDSVGRGESIPAGLIPPPIIAGMNDLTGKLGYLPIDGGWGTPGRPADPRLPNTVKVATSAMTGADPDVEAADVLEGSLRTRLAGVDDRFTRRWQSAIADKFAVVSRVQATGSEARWVVDLAARTITRDDAAPDETVIDETVIDAVLEDADLEDALAADPDPDPDPEDAEWTILGSPATWQAILSGQVNLHVALRRCEMRYCSTGEDGVLTSDMRITMLADLLGVSSWQLADADAVELAGPVRVGAEARS
jgi:hypothetical protein